MSIERLKNRSTKQPNGCWIWNGFKNEYGYGQMKVNGKVVYCHRYSYEQHKGAIPDGLVIRHKCDTPACWNPAHLELGTHQENVADRVKRKRSASGESHGKAKLTENLVSYIRMASEDGALKYRLAKRFDVDIRTIDKIVKNETWRELA